MKTHSRQLVRSHLELFRVRRLNKVNQSFKEPVLSILFFVAKQNVNAAGIKVANLEMYCVQLIKLRQTYLKRPVKKPNFAMDAKIIQIFHVPENNASLTVLVRYVSLAVLLRYVQGKGICLLGMSKSRYANARSQ